MGCSKPTTIDGNWQIDLNIQGKNLPVIMHINPAYNGIVTGELINGTEVIELNGTLTGKKFKLDIGTSYSHLLGEILEDGQIKGTWTRTLKSDFHVSFSGKKTQLQNLFSTAETQKNLIDLSGKWKVSLSNDRYGLGVFKQIGSHVYGSILTETGDFRYLDGTIVNNKLTLIGFDGTFSNIFELVVLNKSLQGMHYSGTKFQQKILAVRDDSFQLSDPNTLTNIKDGIEFLKLPKKVSLLGETIDFEADRYLGKVKVIQLFGSWCPNCMDETKFFVDWRKQHQILLNDVEFIALAWEVFQTEEQAKKALRKFKVKMQMDYPIILMDYKSTKSVLDTIPFEKMVAFPTTLFLGKDNKIEKIHTGFSGQATGPYFDLFTKEFEETLIELIKK